MLKDTLNFDPELGCDANRGNGCCFHFAIVLQLQFTAKSFADAADSPLRLINLYDNNYVNRSVGSTSGCAHDNPRALSRLNLGVNH